MNSFALALTGFVPPKRARCLRGCNEEHDGQEQQRQRNLLDICFAREHETNKHVAEHDHDQRNDEVSDDAICRRNNSRPN